MNHPVITAEDQAICSTAFGTWLWNPQSRVVKYSSKTTSKIYNLKQLSKRRNTYSRALRTAAKLIAKYPEYRQMGSIETIEQLREKLV